MALFVLFVHVLFPSGVVIYSKGMRSHFIRMVKDTKESLREEYRRRVSKKNVVHPYNE